MRLRVVALTGTCLALFMCKTAPPPENGAAQGTFCGSDLECNDGLVCTCGQCLPPGDVDQPPACSAATGCPAFPTSCITQCGGTFVGDAACTNGVESCATGVLASSCGVVDAGVACSVDSGPLPSGFECVDGEVTCIQPGVLVGNCQTGDCDGLTPFLCVTSCSDPAPVTSSCVNHAYGCDEQGGFPQSNCADAGVVDAGPVDAGFTDAGCGDQVKPLCLHNCDPADSLDIAACRFIPDAGEDWSCAGFTGYTPADQCPVDAGPADAGIVDAG